MFGKKKKCGYGEVIMSSVMKALGLYIGVIGVRLQLISYDWLAWDALIFYLVAVLIFGWGIAIQQCTK
jgi:hypothetical protein